MLLTKNCEVQNAQSTLPRKYMLYSPYFPTCSSRVRNVRETMRLKIQFVAVASEVPELLAQVGYISELTVHGIGPSPAMCKKLTKIHSKKKQNTG